MSKPPYSIVEYNKFRINSLSVNIANRELLCIDIPKELRPQLTGAISLLLDVNFWRDYDNVTQEYMYELCNNEIKFVDICEIIADCIRTNNEVQAAIQQSSAAGVGAGTVINNTQYSILQLISPIDTSDCGNDERFGRIVSFVQFVDDVQQDFFESLDAATNIISQFDELISAIPLVETLPIDEFVGLIGSTGEFWRDSYLASLNTQLLEDFECRLYCAYNECSLTVADIRDLILDRYNFYSTQGTLNILSASALIGRLALTIASGGLGTYIGDDFVYLSWLLQLAAVEGTGQFFGVTPDDYVNAASAYTPDPSWSSCDCAEFWTYEVDFTQGLGKFTAKSGNWFAGTGIVSGTQFGSEASWFEPTVTVGPNTAVNSIVVTYTVTSKCESSSRWSVVHTPNYSNPVRTLAQLSIGTTTRECYTSGNQISVRIRNSSAGSCSNLTISRVKVSGTGPNPFA